MQRTTNDSEEHSMSPEGTRLQTRLYGKGRDRKILMGNITRKRRLRWMGHVARMERERRGLYMPWTGVRTGSVEEACRERNGSKLL